MSVDHVYPIDDDWVAVVHTSGFETRVRVQVEGGRLFATGVCIGAPDGAQPYEVTATDVRVNLGEMLAAIRREMYGDGIETLKVKIGRAPDCESRKATASIYQGYRDSGMSRSEAIAATAAAAHISVSQAYRRIKKAREING